MNRQAVNIAVCAPLSGRAAMLGQEMVQAVGLAVSERHALDGVGIGLKVYDDEGKADVALRIAREIAADEHIIGCVGNYGSDTTLAAARVYCSHGLAIIVPVASNPMLTESGFTNVFRYTNRDDHTAQAIAAYLYHQLGKRRAVVVRTMTAYGQSMAIQFMKAFAAVGGIVRAIFSLEEATPDFSAMITHWPGNTDLVFYGGTFEGAPLLRVLRQAGHRQLMATGDGCWDLFNFIEPAGELLEQDEGVLVLSASAAVGKTEASTAVALKYEARFGKIGNYALNCYDAATILIKAIREAHDAAAGALTRTNVLAALHRLSFAGIANPHPLEWDAKGDNQQAITVLNTVKNRRFQEAETIVNLRSYTSGITLG